jgi:TolB-like protein/DNA-binding winged helix-turn-helix (wHTH) protein/Tfp pilus assembly protein PilF
MNLRSNSEDFPKSNFSEASSVERPVYRLGAVEIDLGQNCIRRDGIEQSVRPKTVQVLAKLLDQGGRIVTKRELIESIWKDTAVTEDTLVQCIVEIRKLLGDNSRAPRYLKTVPKVGYRLIGPVKEVRPREHGGNRTQDAMIEGAHWKWRWRFATLVALSLVASLLTLNYGFPRKTQARSGQTPAGSIAVLPFANLTGDPQYEYLGDGITGQVTSELVRMRRFHVVARTSVLRFKGKSQDVRDLGRQLNADTIVEGSIQKDGQQIRVIAAVIRASDGYQLWSGSYERGLKDLSAVVEGLSRNIAASLAIKAGPGAFRTLHVPADAYDLYIKGRYYWDLRTEGSLLQSLQCFEQAIAIKPDYALAYAGLADSYAVLVADRMGDGRQFAMKAKAAANTAIALDPELSDPHAALATVATYEWDWTGAEAEFARGIALDPDSATAHQWFGRHWMRLLRFDDSLREMKIAHSLDPVSLMIRTNLTSVYFGMKRDEEGFREARAILDLDPGFIAARLCLGDALTQRGRFDEALEEYMRANPRASRPQTFLRAAVLAREGRLREAKPLVRRLANATGKDKSSAYDLAALYALTGDADHAFELLNQAGEDRFALAELQFDYAFDNVRADPRYKTLIKKIGFPQN